LNRIIILGIEYRWGTLEETKGIKNKNEEKETNFCENGKKEGRWTDQPLIVLRTKLLRRPFDQEGWNSGGTTKHG